MDVIFIVIAGAFLALCIASRPEDRRWLGQRLEHTSLGLLHAALSWREVPIAMVLTLFVLKAQGRI